MSGDRKSYHRPLGWVQGVLLAVGIEQAGRLGFFPFAWKKVTGSIMLTKTGSLNKEGDP
jgi:hypothetical protein